MINQIADEFKGENEKDFNEFKAESITSYNSLLFDEQYTIVTRPSESVKQTIQGLIGKLKDLEPKHFYYPSENLHLTILGGITTQLDSDVFANLEPVFSNYKLNFHLQGIRPSSPIIAYPDDFSIHTLRDKIRETLGTEGENYSALNYYYEHIAWVNIMRFHQTPGSEFIALLQTFHSEYFGDFQAETIEVYKTNSRVLDPHHATLIKKFQI